MIKKHKRLFIFLFFLLTSTIILLFTSKCSPLYPFNDWVDINAFFTVGKSITRGILPYRDIFEQKGPILYFLFTLGYLISHKSFIGIFIFEIINFVCLSYLIYKIANLYIKEKSSLLIVPIMLTIIATCSSFVHGGSAEEFSLCLYILPLYYFLKHFKKQELTNKELLILGIGSSIILQTKYTLLGIYIGFCIALLIDMLTKKELKKLFKYILFFFIGFMIPTILLLIYFVLTHSLTEYLYVYYYINITKYPVIDISLPRRMYKIVLTFGYGFLNSSLAIVILYALIIPSLIVLHKKEYKLNILLLIICAFSAVGIYGGLIRHAYYFLPLSIFIIFSLVLIFFLLEKVLLKKYAISLVIITIICLVSSYFFANYKESMFKDKEDLFQYKFAEIINKDEEATLLEIGTLDPGVYTVTGIFPSTYYFETQNIDYLLYPNILDSLNSYINNKEVKYIVFFTASGIEPTIYNYPNLLTNYEIVLQSKSTFEGYDADEMLLRVKED